jgi:photosystem II stability/assembly factor-like uncharacterized protein
MKVSFITLILLSLFLFSNKVYSQWEQTNGPFGGTVGSPIAEIGNNLYLGTPDRLFVSSNGGADWRVSIDGNGYLSPMEMTFSNGNIYLATRVDGIFKSTNQGQSWDSINSPYHDIFSINSSGNILFAGTHGLYRSTDNGNSWTRILFYPQYFDVFCLAVNGSNVYVGSKGILKSTDYGDTWTQIFTDTIRSFEHIKISGNNIFATSQSSLDYGVYISTNDGSSWTLSHNGLPSPSTQSATALAYDGTNLYVAYYYPPPFNQLYYSSNNGMNFLPAGNRLPDRTITSLYPSANQLFTGTDNYGVYSTTDLGSTWNLKNNGITEPIWCVSSNGNLILAGTPFGLYMSTNSGNSWNETGLIYEGISSVIANNGKIFASTGTGIQVSSDNGATWSVSSAGIHVSSFYSDGSNIFACGWGTGINLTTDNGLTWTALNNGISHLNTVCLVRKGDKLFCGTIDGNPLHVFLYVSTNYGLNWTATSLIQKSMYALFVQGNSIIAGTYGAGIYISTDDGVTWFQSLSQYPKIVRNIVGNQNVLFSSANNYFTTLDSGVYYSTDGGLNWSPFNDGLVDYRIPYLALNNNILYGGTGASVWKRDVTSLVGINLLSSNIPNKFAIYQNYPNPFNPSTKISYDLPSEVNVKLTVYDDLGREIKTLVNEKQNAGKYEIEFDASNYPSGVYFYKLETARFMQTRKMVLIK